jgi:flagellar hook-associated protein 1 FlgK
MSLTIAFKSAQLGLAQAEKKIAIVSSNINNADRPGYTRKTLNSTYIFNGLASLPLDGKVVQAVANPLLVKQVIQQVTNASNQKTLSTYISNYGQAFGSTAEGATTLQSSVDTLLSTMQVLEANAGDKAAKSKVISTASQLASSLNTLSQAVQSQRLRANNDITISITSINESLKSIGELNKSIGAADAAGRSTGDLEDERNIALQNLSEQLGTQYFIDGNNQAKVYTTGGTSLVSGSGYAQLSYNAVGVVTSGTTYPGGFAPIDLNGSDITTSIQTGKLGALIELRDTLLPNEQAKLDMLANTLQTTVNTVLNQGASYPPLATVTGTEVVTAATPFSGTGNLRVAVTDAFGALTNYQDINLGTVAPATVGGLISALNAVPGVSASINANGYLEVTATSPTGRISMNPTNTNVGGVSATQFFGFNNLFTNTTTGAATIQVNSNLLSNYDALAVGTLSNSAAPVAGDYVMTSGDVSTMKNLIDVFRAPQVFSAAGNFAARNSSLSNYAGAIISDIATQGAAAKNSADTAEATFTYLSTNLANEGGVNVDEETANLTSLQTAYQANAQIISTIRSLFQTLIDAVR